MVHRSLPAPVQGGGASGGRRRPAGIPAKAVCREDLDFGADAGAKVYRGLNPNSVREFDPSSRTRETDSDFGADAGAEVYELKLFESKLAARV